MRADALHRSCGVQSDRGGDPFESASDFGGSDGALPCPAVFFQPAENRAGSDCGGGEPVLQRTAGFGCEIALLLLASFGLQRYGAVALRVECDVLYLQGRSVPPFSRGWSRRLRSEPWRASLAVSGAHACSHHGSPGPPICRECALCGSVAHEAALEAVEYLGLIFPESGCWDEGSEIR